MGSEIHQYIHCAECFNELSDGDSPKEYQVLEIGWTEKGLQIWCRRHSKNVLHLDFAGQKLKALATDWRSKDKHDSAQDRREQK